MPYKDKEKAREYYRKYYWERGGKERDSARHKIYYKKNKEKILSKQHGGCDLDCENCKFDDCINDKVPISRAEMTPERLEKRRAYDREYRRKRIKDAKAKGMCTNCFKRPQMSGILRCYECSIKFKRYRQKYSAKHNKREQRQEDGLCTICGGKRFGYKKVCEKHYNMLCINMAKARSHPNVFAERERFKKIVFGGGKE